MSDLGWERKRYRFNGTPEYAYGKGTVAERAMQRTDEYDPHMRSVRIETATN